MLFDKLCWCAERHLPHLKKTLAEARIFTFPFKPQDVLPKEFTRNEQEFLWDNFFLPFDVVAIEDLCSCIVLANKVPDQHGLSDDRFWIEIIDGDITRAKNFRDGHLAEGLSQDDFMPKDAFLVTTGVIKSEWPAGEKSKLTWNVGLISADMMEGDKRLDVLGSVTEDPRLGRSARQNVITAVEEVMYINSPDRFVIEKTAAKVKPHTGPKIARSHQRPAYTILKPDEIRKTLGLSEPVAGKHGSPTPHERRRHFRTFRDPKFVNMQGRTVTVKACWVGPSEATVGKHHYRVMLDI